MTKAGEIEMRILGLAAALACFVTAPAEALTFADVIPDKEYALGFDVPAPSSPDVIFSQDMGDFLAASTNPADGAAVTFSLSECFVYTGSFGCQATVPTGVAYTGVTRWTVTDIDIDVPAEGLFLFIGGMGNGETPGPDYPLGSVQVLTSGGLFGGELLPALSDGLLSFGQGMDYVYYGTRIFEVGDSLTFGYQVDEQHAGGTPILFSNVGRNIVPEPGTFVLVGLGLAVMASRRTRRAGRPRS